MALIDKRIISLTLQMSQRQRRFFAADCAEHVLHLYENIFDGNERPRKAIQVARRYADGQATLTELEKSKSDAEMAAWDAAAQEQTFELEAAASAAATAEMTVSYPESAQTTLEATINTALETVLTATIGANFADQVWRTKVDWARLPEEVARLGRRVVEEECAWQMQRAATYVNDDDN